MKSSLRQAFFFPILFIALSFAASALNVGTWPKYQNSRFGYHVKTPPGLQVSNRAADNSGTTWQTGTVRMQVSGTNNPYQIKAPEYFARIRTLAGEGLVSERRGRDSSNFDWYELLYTKDGRRIHQKVYVGASSINSVEFSYAYRYREQKERLGEVVLDTFHPGDLSKTF